jgi:hypothetical protein
VELGSTLGARQAVAAVCQERSHVQLQSAAASSAGH